MKYSIRIKISFWNYVTCHSYIGWDHSNPIWKLYFGTSKNAKRAPSTIHSKTVAVVLLRNPCHQCPLNWELIGRFQKRLLGVVFGTCEIQWKRDSSVSLPFLLDFFVIASWRSYVTWNVRANFKHHKLDFPYCYIIPLVHFVAITLFNSYQRDWQCSIEYS